MERQASRDTQVSGVVGPACVRGGRVVKMLMDLCHQNPEAILDEGLLVSHFQPIISVRKKAVIGFEGLTRGILPPETQLIPPMELFSVASHFAKSLDFFRMVTKTVMRNFETDPSWIEEPFLFLNYDVSLVKPGCDGPEFIRKAAMDLGLEPSSVVIEFTESKSRDRDVLAAFVDRVKSYGFLVALDDVGAGHSNFDRIPVIRPDVIKVDRSIITDIANDYYKQEIFRSIVNLSRKIGSLVLAEGVETEEEALICLDYGADLFQGFYFGHPGELGPQVCNVRKKITRIAEMHKEGMIHRIKAIRERHRSFNDVIRDVTCTLSGHCTGDFENILGKTLSDLDNVEALYILDMTGRQVTETVLRPGTTVNASPIFQPANKGEDHSMKEYFYTLMNTGLERYTTDTYLSLATGSLCRTLAISFVDSEGDRHILCMDVNER